jgi:hypothetical protein
VDLVTKTSAISNSSSSEDFKSVLKTFSSNIEESLSSFDLVLLDDGASLFEDVNPASFLNEAALFALERN